MNRLSNAVQLVWRQSFQFRNEALNRVHISKVSNPSRKNGLRQFAVTRPDAVAPVRLIMFITFAS